MLHDVTLFANINEVNVPYVRPLKLVLDRIVSDKTRELIEPIRKEKDKVKRNIMKKALTSICFSGTFSKRSDDAMEKHSGLICLNFNNFKSKTEMRRVRAELCEDEFVYVLFTSPSGDGLKILVKVPPVKEWHREHFYALSNYYVYPNFDKSCVNESMVCYISWDPQLYINENATEWTEREQAPVEEIISHDTVTITDHKEVIDNLQKWWDRDYGLHEGKRNTNLFILACAHCNFGVPLDTCLNHLLYLKSFDSVRSPHREIESIVNSAYKSAQFNIKQFEDRKKIESYLSKIRNGADKTEIKKSLVDDNVVPEVAERIAEELEQSAYGSNVKFWNRSPKGVISLQHHLFRDFLVQNGFFKYYPEGSSNHIFVHRSSNRVRPVMDQTIKDFVLEYVERQVGDYSVWNFFAENTKYFSELFLTMLPEIKIDFIRDTINESYLFYQNTAVVVRRNALELIDYDMLNGWIWEDQMIPREFFSKTDATSDYSKFISNVCSDDKDRIASLRSTIGFLLHTYKDPGYCPAVILNDEVISDNPEGGTGKGIFFTGISHIRKMVLIDGKRFSFDKSFPYQTVKPDTQVLLFDDIKKSFDFESLFSVITNGIEIEKKNKDAISIPFDKSPKIGITTNYGVRGSGDSFERRKWEVELTKYYTASFTPVHEFGKRFFEAWNKEEWSAYDHFMISCLQLYLDRGFIKANFKNVKTRRFISETSHDFYEWMEQDGNKYAHTGITHLLKSMQNDFVSEYTDWGPYGKLKITSQRFNQWVHSYALYRFGTEVVRGRRAEGNTIEFVEAKKQGRLL